MTASRLSVQLYTVREALADDLDGSLARLAALGFENVEPFAFTDFPGLGASLARHGLAAPTTHAGVLAADDLSALFGAAAELGVQTVIDPFVPPERWQSADAVAATADALAAASEVAAEFGLRLGYHNHAHELQNSIEGVSALEYFAERLAPGIVLEVDTYWAAVGGVDPVGLLNRLGDRVVAIHVKDGPGTAETKDQVAVGSGSLPIRDIIDAAPDALRVIELDDSRGDRFQAVADSIRFLTEEGLA